jgi:membrane protease YdiL (CAAX protease family)
MHPIEYGAAPARREQPATIPLPREVLPLAVMSPLLMTLAGAVGAVTALVFTESDAVVLAVVGLVSALVVLALAQRISRRHGTGDVSSDFGVHLRPIDLARAVGFAVLTQIVVLVVGVAVAAVDEDFSGGNLQDVEIGADEAATAVLVFAAVVLAPLTEETVFRGILLQALRARLATPAAVVLQAVAFGLVHLGAYGARNVSVFLGTAAIGVVLGVIAVRDGRLGAAMMTHAIFNAASLALVAATAT